MSLYHSTLNKCRARLAHTLVFIYAGLAQGEAWRCVELE